MNRRICFCQKGTLQQCILHSGRRLLQTSLRPLRTFLRHHSGPLCCILWSLPEFWKEAKHSLLGGAIGPSIIFCPASRPETAGSQEMVPLSSCSFASGAALPLS